MSGLQKATLTAIRADGSEGPPHQVQFNPTSMRLAMTNSVDMGRTRARQIQQFTANSSTTLTLDLHFDTADEGTTASPRNVREKTQVLEQFMLPTRQSEHAPPRVQFQWGSFVYIGVMNSMTEDIDLFSANGVPLRAKCSVSIKEQDPRFQRRASGAGARQPPRATPGVTIGRSTGQGQGLDLDRTAPAIGGESAAEFAARHGLDPSAWRGIAAGLDSSLALPAGLEIPFSTDLSAQLGVGLSAGFEAGASVSLDAAFGLELDLDVGLDLDSSLGAAAGFALTAAGGVTAALEALGILKAEQAAGEARAAFGQPAAPAAAPSAGTHATALGTASVSAPARAAARAGATPRPAGPASARPPLPRGAPPALTVRGPSGPSGAARPAADTRATTFGLGVPLRPRVPAPPEARPAAASGRAVVTPRAPLAAGATLRRDPTAPPWESGARAPMQAAAAQRRRTCGCGRGAGSSGCGCGGRR